MKFVVVENSVMAHFDGNSDKFRDSEKSFFMSLGRRKIHSLWGRGTNFVISNCTNWAMWIFVGAVETAGFMVGCMKFAVVRNSVLGFVHLHFWRRWRHEGLDVSFGYFSDVVIWPHAGVERCCMNFVVGDIILQDLNFNFIGYLQNFSPDLNAIVPGEWRLALELRILNMNTTFERIRT